MTGSRQFETVVSCSQRMGLRIGVALWIIIAQESAWAGSQLNTCWPGACLALEHYFTRSLLIEEVTSCVEGERPHDPLLTPDLESGPKLRRIFDRDTVEYDVTERKAAWVVKPKSEGHSLLLAQKVSIPPPGPVHEVIYLLVKEAATKAKIGPPIQINTPLVRPDFDTSKLQEGTLEEVLLQVLEAGLQSWNVAIFHREIGTELFVGDRVPSVFDHQHPERRNELPEDR